MALTDNLVGFWAFGEAGGYRYNTMEQTLAASFGENVRLDPVTGNPLGGKMLALDGSATKFLTVNNRTNYNVGSGQFTIGILVKFSSLASASGIVGQWQASGNQLSWRLRYATSTNRLHFYVSANGSTSVNVQASSLGAPVIGTWYLIFAGWDGSNIWIQANNGATNTAALGSAPFSSTAPLRVSNVDGEYVAGNIARFYLWKRTLTTTERTTLYNGGAYLDPTAPFTSPYLWRTTFSPGDLSELTRDGGGTEELSGIASTSDETTIVFTGSHSRKHTITTPNTPSSGARLFRWAELRNHPEGCYVATAVYFPQILTPNGAGDYMNLFQFKSHGATSNPAWFLSVNNRANGAMYLRLAEDNSGGFVAWHEQTVVDLVPGKWGKLEAFLVQSSTGTGQLTIWQDGTVIFALTNITTLFSGTDVQDWAVNLYSDSLSPSGAVSMYTGEMAASLSHIYSA